MKIPRLKSNKHLYDLNGQINHKVFYSGTENCELFLM